MTPEAALACWGEGGPLRAADDGLINRTWLVGAPPIAVLQWVNPIFKPSVHLDIEAITDRLSQRGLLTPRLRATLDGRRWIEDEGGCWRLLTYVPGLTVHRMDSPARAATTGGLVGRFHAALADWDYTFQHRRPGAHDTPRHMDTLRAALDEADGHALAAPARAVGEEVLARWSRWDGTLELPDRIGHGDLKVSNVRFDEQGQIALCMLDLDTLAHLPFAVEMGDAWRSWCNPAGEDRPDEAAFDLDLFEASASEWLRAAPPLTDLERASLVPGVERIALELSARFCADAVRNTYFREDRARHPVAGAHNLLRARGQLNLARSIAERRARAEAILASASIAAARDGGRALSG